MLKNARAAAKHAIINTSFAERISAEKACTVLSFYMNARLLPFVYSEQRGKRIFATCACFVFMSIASVTSAQSSHVRLGEPELRSALGSPLVVRFPIEASDTNEEILASRFSLGSSPSGSGIPYLQAAEVALERVGTKYFLIVRSRQAIGEPVIGLVLRERLPSGTRSREITLFLDPPVLSQTNVELADAGQRVDSVAPFKAAAVTNLTPATAAGEARTEVASEPLPARTSRKRAKRERGGIQSVTVNETTSAQTPPEAPRKKKTRSARAETGSQTLPRGTSTNLSGPKLSLMMSNEPLRSVPNASEETRAELRLRRMLLDLDDLTSALLERQNRITQLEKELGALTTRINAAETIVQLNKAQALATATALDPQASAQSPALISPPAPSAVSPSGVNEVPSAAAQPAAPSAVDITKSTDGAGPRPRVERTGASSLWWILPLAAIAALLAFVIRRALRRSSDAYRLNIQPADAYVAQAVKESGSVGTVRVDQLGSDVQRNVTQASEVAHETPPSRTRKPEVASPSVANTNRHKDIDFDLPHWPKSLDQTNDPAMSEAPVAAGDLGDQPGDTNAIPGAHHATRRAKFLQSRYHDIAILNPALDAPQRLLWQAGTLYGEGATDFAKRLLKYAAYSRQLTEEYWLALFELLYREKLTNEYVINAQWFAKHHARSPNWNEVQRIGYLLDPTEPLFASAAAWSRETPATGLWLPAGDVPDKAPVAPTFTLALSE